MLERITAIVNAVLKEEGASTLTPEDVVKLIGEKEGGGVHTETISS